MVAAAARPGVLPHRVSGRPHAGEPPRAARAEGKTPTPNPAEPRLRPPCVAVGRRSPSPCPPQDKAPPKRPATTFLPWLLESIRRLSLPFSGPAVLWSLYLGAASAALLRALARRPRGGAPPARHKGPKRGDPVDRGGGEKNGQVRRKEEREERGEGRARGAADGEGPRGTKKKK